LSSLSFDIADNRVGGDAGEIGDVAVNDCLADDRLTRFSSDICLISWRMIDMMFPFCGLSASFWAAAVTSSTKAAEVVSPALLGPLTRMEA
jgi:hypothetical protein